MRYLLDTNILSDLVRNPHGRIAARIMSAGEEQVATSIIVAAELRYGGARRGSPRLATQLEAVLGALEVLPLKSPADVIYGKLRSRLEADGTLIGPNDLLIAAHALSLGLILVTDNESEFRRVPALRVDNWLQSKSPRH